MKAKEPAIRRPETMGQALAWQRQKARYLALGYCHRCAAQAACGHQLGFSRVKPPCLTCVQVEAGGCLPSLHARAWARPQMAPEHRFAVWIDGTIPMSWADVVERMLMPQPARDP